MEATEISIDRQMDKDVICIYISTHVAANSIISFFLQLSNIPLCICVCIYIYIYTHTYIPIVCVCVILLRYKKNGIMPSAATWVDLEIIILSEVSQTKTNII